MPKRERSRSVTFLGATVAAYEASSDGSPFTLEFRLLPRRQREADIEEFAGNDLFRGKGSCH
jgi:hypothetical protein